MKEKIVGICICMLVLATAVPAVGSENKIKIDTKDSFTQAATSGEWYLQWNHTYGGYRLGGTNPIGDIDEDGSNEIIISGTDGCRILSYDEEAVTYVEEYTWNILGWVSGICIIDLDDDEDLEFCVTACYSAEYGIYAYDWDGTTLTQLDKYNGSGVDAPWVTVACDYDEDGDVELISGNEPASAPATKHVIALGWDNINNQFVEETYYLFTGHETKESTVGFGDPDNDGHIEIIVTLNYGSVSDTGTWVLHWNTTSSQWEAEVVSTEYPTSTPLSIAVGDVNKNGIPEIAIGNWAGITAAWVYEWNGNAYEEIWYKEYAGETHVHYGLAIGDADNDGEDELCIATNQVHIYQWDGTDYVEEALLTDPTASCSWMQIGDCDSDGLNELKTCAHPPDGTEYIYKYITESNTPPSIPVITGPIEVKRGAKIDYTFVSTDPEGQDVQYYIDWDDNTYDQWNGTYSSGEEVIKSHTWAKKGKYNITVKARDSEGAESDWGELTITVPKYSLILNAHFQNIFEIIRNMVFRVHYLLAMITHQR